METTAINMSIPIPAWEGLEKYREQGPLGYESAVTHGVDIAMSALIKYVATAYGELPDKNSDDYLLIADVMDIMSEMKVGRRQIVIRTSNEKLVNATAKERTMYLISGMINASIPIPNAFDGFYAIV